MSASILTPQPLRPPSEPALVALAEAAAHAVLAHVPDVMREIRSAMRQEAPEGLSVPQFRSLIFTERTPGATMGALAAHLGITLPTASVMVARLQREGWLDVMADAQDRRRRMLALTPSGQALVQAAWAHTRQAFAQRLEDLGGPALAQLAQSLAQLRSVWPPEQAGPGDAGPGGAGGAAPAQAGA